MAPLSPAVACWALGLRLREKRESRGLTSANAAKLIGITSAYLSEVEHGKKTMAVDRLDDLIADYGFAEDEAEELRSLREQACLRGWWANYGTLFNAELLRFFGLEHGAERIHSFDSSVVNGLLQTEDYAHAIIEAGSPNVRLAESSRRVRCRMTRQKRITEDNPPRFCAVMSEAALRQEIGGRRVLKAQLEHMAGLIDQYPETLEIRIVPFEANGYGAIGGSTFTVMSFPEGTLPTLLWQETVTSTLLCSDEVTVREYVVALSGAMDCSLSREDSLEFIRKASCEL